MHKFLDLYNQQPYRYANRGDCDRRNQRVRQKTKKADTTAVAIARIAEAEYRPAALLTLTSSYLASG